MKLTTLSKRACADIDKHTTKMAWVCRGQMGQSPQSSWTDYRKPGGYPIVRLRYLVILRGPSIFRRERTYSYTENRKAAYCVRVFFLGATKEPPIAFAFPVFRRDEGAAYCIRFSRFFFRATYSPLWQLPTSL